MHKWHFLMWKSGGLRGFLIWTAVLKFSFSREINSWKIKRKLIWNWFPNQSVHGKYNRIPNQSENGKYNPIPGWCNKISESFLSAWEREERCSAHSWAHPQLWEKAISDSSQIERNTTVETVFLFWLWTKNGRPFYTYIFYNQEENCRYDRIPFDLRGIGNLFLWESWK